LGTFFWFRIFVRSIARLWLRTKWPFRQFSGELAAISSLFRREMWRRPFFCAAPAVLAPWVLEFFDDGAELLAAGPVAPFFIAVPPPVVVPPFMGSPVVVLLAAGPPASELPPAEFLCAITTVVDGASTAANPELSYSTYGRTTADHRPRRISRPLS
jgi:hypothetical protein